MIVPATYRSPFSFPNARKLQDEDDGGTEDDPVIAEHLYSHDAQVEMVGVARALGQRHDAVSVEVAAAMAEGGIRFSRAGYGVVVTGVAGPEGGTAANPVGTVCFAWVARRRETLSVRVHVDGDRHGIREQSAAHALAGLLDFIRA